MGISTIFEHTLTEQCTYAETAISELLVQILIITISDPNFLKRATIWQSDNVFKTFCSINAVISTLRWAVLTVLWIGFCHTGPILLCVDLFMFFCVYFVCFCFILHSCCIILSAVGWTRWDWSLILRTYLPSVLWHCWLGHFTGKIPSPIWPIMCLVGL